MTNIKFSDILRFCEFDIFHNDIFTVGGSVFRQVRGLAIGGTGSAQLANITRFQAEVKGYPSLTPVTLDPTGQHPSDLPVHPYRYVDNICGVKRRDTPLNSILENFQHMYGIHLQEESEGHTLTTLLSELSIEDRDGFPHVGIRMANKHSTSLPPEQFVYRFPDKSTPTARQTVRSTIPSLAKSAMVFRDTQHDVAYNVELIKSTMIMKSYPTDWWKPLLWHKLSCWGATPQVLALC